MTDGWEDREQSNAINLGPRDQDQKQAGGLLVRVEHNQGQNKNTNIYTFVKQDGDEINVWGSTVIDGRIHHNPDGGRSDVGSFVTMKFLGTPYVGEKQKISIIKLHILTFLLDACIFFNSRTLKRRLQE